jgi:hypothetical protein
VLSGVLPGTVLLSRRTTRSVIPGTVTAVATGCRDEPTRPRAVRPADGGASITACVTVGTTGTPDR